MLSVPLPHLGQRQQFMGYNFVALAVVLVPINPKKLGLIDGPPLSQKTMAEGGKNFISANVDKHGGPGVAIAPHLI